MGDEVVFELKRQICNVLELVADVTAADGRHRERLLPEQVIHYRQVVRSEVPNNVHVVLEKPQIHTHGIEIIDLAKATGGDDLLHLADSTRIDECMIDKDRQPFLFCQVDQLVGLGNTRGHRFFDKDVLSGVQRAFCDRMM